MKKKIIPSNNFKSLDLTDNDFKKILDEDFKEKSVLEKREQIIIDGLTIKDIKICLVKSLIISSEPLKKMTIEEMFKCYTFLENGDIEHTQYLKDNQDLFFNKKVELGTESINDFSKIKMENINPFMFYLNFISEIEKILKK